MSDCPRLQFSATIADNIREDKDFQIAQRLQNSRSLKTSAKSVAVPKKENPKTVTEKKENPKTVTESSEKGDGGQGKSQGPKVIVQKVTEGHSVIQKLLKAKNAEQKSKSKSIEDKQMEYFSIDDIEVSQNVEFEVITSDSVPANEFHQFVPVEEVTVEAKDYVRSHGVYGEQLEEVKIMVPKEGVSIVSSMAAIPVSVLSIFVPMMIATAQLLRDAATKWKQSLHSFFSHISFFITHFRKSIAISKTSRKPLQGESVFSDRIKWKGLKV